VEGETIKSFLVGLGFGVDDTSLAKFNRAIISASTKVAAMYGGIQLASAGIFAGLAHMSQGFEDVGYQLRLVAPAINKFLILRQAMLSAYRAAGINLTKAVQQSILFNYSLAKTQFALEAVYKSVGMKFIPLLTKQMDLFRAKIFANMPQIQKVLGSIVRALFLAFNVTIQMGTRAWEILTVFWGFLKQLDDATGGWSTRILELVAVWKVLNLSFLATPLGFLLTGIIALIALYDDFKVWQEGGKSFFNWGGDAAEIMKNLEGIVQDLIPTIKELVKSLTPDGSGGLGDTFKKITIAQMAWFSIFAINPFGSFSSRVWSLIKLLGVLGEQFIWIKWISPWLDGVSAKMHDVAKYISGIGGYLSGLGSGAIVNVANAGTPPPLLATPNNSSQSVNQSTNIHVQTTADAEETAKIVFGGQAQTNRDLVRNFSSGVK
jgi:hypothetical protein